MRESLDRNRRLDVRVASIIDQFEILKGEGKQVFDRRIDLHGRQRIGLARELQLRLLQVIEIEVRIAKAVRTFLCGVSHFAVEY